MALNIKPLMPLNHPYIVDRKKHLKTSASSSQVSGDVVDADKSNIYKKHGKKIKNKHKK